jgi:signal transduction histidine kinase
MKKILSTEALDRVSEQLDEIVRVERTRALEIVEELENFTIEHDFSEYPEKLINIYIGLARFHINGRDPKEAELVLQKALEIAESHALPDEVFHVQSTMAIIHSMRGDHLRAIYTWEDMLAQMDSSHNMWMPIVNNLVVAYGFTMQFARAVDLCFELLQYLDDNPTEPEVRISALINLGNSYRPLKSHDKALKAYEEAIEIATKENILPYLSYALGNMALTMSDLNRFDEAYDYIVKSLDISRKFYGDEHIADTLSTMGSICNKLRRWDEAEKCLSQALNLLNQEDDKVGYINTLLNLATMHIEQEQYEQSHQYLLLADTASKDMDIIQHRINLHKLWANYYENTGDLKEANESLHILNDLQEQQYTELSEKLISKQEAEYLRRKIEMQNQIYQEKNTELESSNHLIKRQAQQLEQSNHELHTSLGMLNRLISIISHDVRGPAANSAAALRMIHEGSIRGESASDLMSHIITSLDSVTDLLTEMMVWIESRSFSKDVDRLMQDVSVKELFDPILRMYQSHLEQKRIKLDLNLAGDDLTTYTEPNIMKIVLRNILSNAIKFTPGGGKIHISCRDREQYLELRIRDSGVGMSQEELSRLLKQGLTAKAGTDQELGMGMGIRLSLGYLKLLGVQLDVDSEENQGTEFVLQLRKAKG